MPSLDQEMTCATGHQDFGHHQAPNHQRTSVIKCDILIIGAGAAGLAAAAAAHDPGLRVILVEKEDHVGGTTFRSGGCMWMPNNFLMQGIGIEDSKEQATRYINAVAKLRYSSLEEQAFHGRLRDERLDAFLTQGPEMMRYFRDQEVSALPKGMSRPVSMGRSLIAQLLKVCKEHDNVEIWTGWELSELLLSGHDGGVIGARVQRRGSEELVDIHASLGVILTTGGFSQNQEMRDAYLAGTATSEATSDDGIALRAGQRIGAGSAQLGQVWGIPTMIDPRTGKVTEAMFAISKPFSIVVDGCGRRFFSESQPYGEATTVDEWNEMCDQGRDKHFHRGEDRYQQFIGDPTVVPNPCMGPVKESPFYGIRIFPGDAGTRGGPQTDQFARVLRADGSGAGTTLAPAMTEGFIAVKYMQHLARGSGVILEDR
ncbi:uncharacterized protein FRV6_16855 [Fusarium oxysporum]|uniref:FAD-dependent oxidoreductase 2 FAD-binding domain-containing protein n=1 Tax=Fusarium oxysporum TaxID=5507 RepID=A0A2H3TVV7_FUSOX|nr:uncharacterized protein FRV6_16855 [Fusarium oxysporum]